MNFEAKLSRTLAEIDSPLLDLPTFSLLVEATLPSWLKDLYSNYWRLRRSASERCHGRNGYSDAEICQDVVAYFAKFLKGKGIDTDDMVGYHHGISLHAWNEMDRDGQRWVIDGSWYQIYSYKPYATIGVNFGGRLDDKLKQFKIQTLEEVLHLVDYSDGRKPVWNVGHVTRDESDAIGAIANRFDKAEIDLIRGRLLPFMIRVHPLDKKYDGKRRGERREFEIDDVKDTDPQ